jgi:hypothetical protein
MVFFGMQDLANGEAVRHTVTRECGHVLGSCVKDGETWYRILTLFDETIEEWKASELREAPEIFSLI